MTLNSYIGFVSINLIFLPSGQESEQVLKIRGQFTNEQAFVEKVDGEQFHMYKKEREQKTCVGHGQC